MLSNTSKSIKVYHNNQYRYKVGRLDECYEIGSSIMLPEGCDPKHM